MYIPPYIEVLSNHRHLIQSRARKVRNPTHLVKPRRVILLYPVYSDFHPTLRPNETQMIKLANGIGAGVRYKPYSWPWPCYSASINAGAYLILCLSRDDPSDQCFSRPRHSSRMVMFYMIQNSLLFAIGPPSLSPNTGIPMESARTGYFACRSAPGAHSAIANKTTELYSSSPPGVTQMVTSRRCLPPETRIGETRTILDYIQGNLGLVLGFDYLGEKLWTRILR